jgi:hypothetical protein
MATKKKSASLKADDDWKRSPELVAHVHEVVCQLFCAGKHPKEIVDAVRAHCGVLIGQKDPHSILHQEHAKFLFRSTSYNYLSNDVASEFSVPGRKLGVIVTLTNLQQELVSRGALAAWQIIQDRIAADPNKRDFVVGCSGGHTMRAWARSLGSVLRHSWNKDLTPDKITFKALVSGIDTEAAGTDPSSFFNYFSASQDDGALACDTAFELLSAAPILPPSDHRRLRSERKSRDRPSISAAFQRDRYCDLIVTSAGELEDRHSQLRKCYEQYSPETLTSLKEANCVGDVLWQPISDSGPLDTSSHPYRTMSLIDLGDLPGDIRKGTHVLLILGHCAGGCDRLRTRVLYLALRYHLVTDVVLSRETADALLKLARKIRQTRSALASARSEDTDRILKEQGVEDPIEQRLVLSEAPQLR